MTKKVRSIFFEPAAMSAREQTLARQKSFWKVSFGVLTGMLMASVFNHQANQFYGVLVIAAAVGLCYGVWATKGH